MSMTSDSHTAMMLILHKIYYESWTVTRTHFKSDSFNFLDSPCQCHHSLFLALKTGTEDLMQPVEAKTGTFLHFWVPLLRWSKLFLYDLYVMKYRGSVTKFDSAIMFISSSQERSTHGSKYPSMVSKCLVTEWMEKVSCESFFKLTSILRVFLGDHRATCHS